MVRDLTGQFVSVEQRDVILDIDPVSIPVDPSKVERIVKNLLANRSAACGPGRAPSAGTVARSRRTASETWATPATMVRSYETIPTRK
jgi:hypothetical protein